MSISEKDSNTQSTYKVRMNPVDSAYLAGILDGEGSIVIGGGGKSNPKNLYINVRVTAASRKLVDRCVHLSGVGCIIERKTRTSTGKRVYVWGVSSRQAAELLKAVLPYLILKAPQAKLALRYQETIHQRAGVPGRQGIPPMTEKEYKRRLNYKAQLRQLNEDQYDL